MIVSQLGWGRGCCWIEQALLYPPLLTTWSYPADDVFYLTPQPELHHCSGTGRTDFRPGDFTFLPPNLQLRHSISMPMERTATNVYSKITSHLSTTRSETFKSISHHWESPTQWNEKKHPGSNNATDSALIAKAMDTNSASCWGMHICC